VGLAVSGYQLAVGGLWLEVGFHDTPVAATVRLGLGAPWAIDVSEAKLLARLSAQSPFERSDGDCAWRLGLVSRFGFIG
jgi:hypothetical protein